MEPSTGGQREEADLSNTVSFSCVRDRTLAIDRGCLFRSGDERREHPCIELIEPLRRTQPTLDRD